MNTKMYDIIETAARDNAPVLFPDGVHPVLEVGCNPTGQTFTLRGVYWMDDLRNVYEAWLQIECRRQDSFFPSLYVAGSRALDGTSSGDTTMFWRENRYSTII